MEQWEIEVARQERMRKDKGCKENKGREGWGEEKGRGPSKKG